MKSMKIGLQMLAAGKRYDELESYLSAMTDDNMYNEEAVSEGLSIAGRHKSGKHGYGLDNVRRCVDKYKGTMKLTCDDGKFVAEILVYVSTIK